jgi:hypothetical protein
VCPRPRPAHCPRPGEPLGFHQPPN